MGFVAYLLVITACIKLLLIPTYHSTDFEVHRNWLAITHSLPISQWYIESTSEWTLDYPPFFGWFEWILSHGAKYFDPDMLVVKNLNHASFNTIMFQRLSVMVTDLLFFFSAYWFCNTYYKNNNNNKDTKSNTNNNSNTKENKIIFGDISTAFKDNFANSGLAQLIMVITVLNPDIHFQYNGFLTAILLISLTLILRNQFVLGGAMFAVLLNFKHIYMYYAPAYFVFLLRQYCMNPKFSISLGTVVGIVFALSVGPFLALDQGYIVLGRLFPFGRGLMHAYWAPNVWALYTFVDKVISIALGKESGGLTRGFVGEMHTYSVFPTIFPVDALLCTLVALLPLVIRGLFQAKQSNKPVRDRSTEQSGIVEAVVISGFCFYLFGWHVHEKAILMITIPLSLLAAKNATYARYSFFLATVGHYSLFPLLFTPTEYPIKVLLFLLHTMFQLIFLKPQLSLLEKAYLLGLIPLELFASFIHPLFILPKLPFLPLMAISVYCSVGVIYTFLSLYWKFFLKPANHKLHSQ